MKQDVTGIVEALRRMRAGASAGNEPKGLPTSVSNADRSEDTYEGEGLADPGIQNPVTGSGAGPVIGRRGRASGNH